MSDKTNKLVAAPKEEMVAGGAAIQRLMPGGEALTFEQAKSVANYSMLTGANPFRGEIYGYPGKNGKLTLVDGYKLLIRWAKKTSDYDDTYEEIPVGAEGINEGDVAYRCILMRDDRKAKIREYMELGATFKEAYDIVSNKAVGVVLKSELWSQKYDKPIAPPTGWTWDQVARKRALKNCLNLAYAMPSLDEIAKESWIINQIETKPEDWAISKPYGTPGEAERHAELAARDRAVRDKKAKMDEGELAEYEEVVTKATEAMRDNDSGDEEPPTPPKMALSGRFWKWVDQMEIDRFAAGKVVQEADSDFAKAAELMQESSDFSISVPFEAD